MMADSSLNRENILVAFLYINSYIGCRLRQNDGSEYENAKDNPEAFYRSIKHMAEELSMSKDTINQCIEYLTKSFDSTPALLIKREVGSVQPDKSKPPKNVPNIYVLNKEGYQQEISCKFSINPVKSRVVRKIVKLALWILSLLCLPIPPYLPVFLRIYRIMSLFVA